TGTVVSLGGGSYRVDAPAHTYVEEGTCAVNVTRKHASLAPLTTPNQTIVVADQQLTTLASANLPTSGQEGAALAAVTGIATFTRSEERRVGKRAGDRTPTINWNNTTTTTGPEGSTGGDSEREQA